MSDDDIDIRGLIDEGYDVSEINELLEDEGYDKDDIAEAWVDVGYDWEDALLDSIRDQDFSEDYFKEHAQEWSDLLDYNISDLYDIYFGYEDA